jgi:polyisoprenoid-binding protein YceI
MTPVATQIPTATWTVDPVHSTASFAVKHLGVSTFRAGFDQIDARLEDGVLTGSVQVASITHTNEDLKGHILSPDFFDVANTPTVDFRSASIDVADDGSVRLEGELTIKGTTHPVVATGFLEGPVDGPAGNRVLALALQADINRFDYGLRWQMDLPGGGKALAEQVKLIVELELAEA